MRNTEIERKFLIAPENLPDLSKLVYGNLSQGYIRNLKGNFYYRLRQIIFMSPDGNCLGDRYFQTIKGFGNKQRKEYEIELLKPQFSVFMAIV